MYDIAGVESIFLAFGAFMIFFLIIFLILYIIYVIGLWRLFKKAGKNGWEAIIPYYNTWVYVEISGLNWWYFLLIISSTITSLIGLEELSLLCSLANIVAMFFCNYNVAKKLHKDTGYAVLMTLFPYIMLPVIGFSNNITWDDNVSVSPNGPIGANTNNTYNTNSTTYTTQSNTTEPNNTNNTAKKFCATCGNEILSDTKYCPKCGSEIK